MTLRNGALDLGHRRRGRPDGHNALRDESLAGAGPFFDQPVVISLHASELQVRIFQPREILSRRPCHRRVKHRIVYARRVHGFKPFRRAIGSWRDLLPTAGLMIAIRHQRRRPRGAAVEEHLPIDYPTLGAVGGALDVRDAIVPAAL